MKVPSQRKTEKERLEKVSKTALIIVLLEGISLHAIGIQKKQREKLGQKSYLKK